jgi:hypothetical protein
MSPRIGIEHSGSIANSFYSGGRHIRILGMSGPFGWNDMKDQDQEPRDLR